MSTDISLGEGVNMDVDSGAGMNMCSVGLMV